MQHSSTVAPGNQSSAPFPGQPWDVTESVLQKSATWEYGYVHGRDVLSSTREDLIRIVTERGGEISFVWTPETPQPVHPEQVPFLFDAFRQREVKEARGTILMGAGLAAVGVLAAIALQDWNAISRGLFFVFGAVVLIEGIWRYAHARNYTEADAACDAR